MPTVGVQADISDSEGILGMVRGFRVQLQDIQEINHMLIGLRKLREASVQSTTTISERLSDKIASLLAGAQTVESALNGEIGVSSSARGQSDLTQAPLEKEEGILKSETDPTVNLIDDELIKTGFVEKELFRKMKELSRLHVRLNTAKEEYHKQWGQSRQEADQFIKDRHPLLEARDRLGELKLARYLGTQTDGQSEGREQAKQMINHHWNSVLHRQMREQLTSSRLKETAIEQEIDSLLLKKRELWTRCIGLENCLEQIQDTDNENNMLRPIPAVLRLPESCPDRVTSPESDSDLGLEDHVPEGEHGLMLHRCQKQTRLSVELSVEERQMLESLANPVTGTSKQEVLSQRDFELCATSGVHASADDMLSRDQQVNLKRALSKEVMTRLQQDDISTKSSRECMEKVSGETIPLEHAQESNLSLMAKIRKRVGGITRSSLSQRIKGSKQPTTGSTRLSDGSSGRRRR